MFGLLVYFDSLNNKFLMDDYAFLGNPVFSSMKYISSQWNPFRDQILGIADNHGMFNYYRPMAHIVYNFCYATFKNNFWQYHLFNLFLFVFAASLIYVLVGKISCNDNLAILTSIFYLIHPINGIVVNYISASVFALQAIFMLATILTLWESLERKNDRALYFFSLFFSFLSLFWHESGIMTSFYVSSVILLFRKDPIKSKILCLLPFFIIVFSYIVFRFFFVSVDVSILKGMTFYHMTVWEYFGTIFRVIIWYITRLFYPRGIVMQWATPILHQYIFWDNWGAFSLLLLFFLLFAKFAKEKIIRLALIWIMIGFAPVFLAAFRMIDFGALIEPHWFIFSSIGFFILGAYFFLMILVHSKKLGLLLLFIVIFAWGSVSHAYNQLWADQKTYALFWSRQVPNLKSTYYYLAYAYQNEGVFNESRKYYKLALNGTSLDLDIYQNLGVIDVKDGHWKDAEINFRRVLAINSFSEAAYNNLGSLYQQQGQWKKAKEYFSQALVYNPLMVEPRVGLAYNFLESSEYQKAIDLCLKNLDIVNDDTNTLFLLVDIYGHKKDFVNLNKYAYRIIENESDPKVLMQLGRLMAQNNIINIAIDSYIKILQVAPNYKDAYYEIGKLLENSKKYDEAIQIWKIGFKIDPSDQRFKNVIAKAIKLKLK